MCGMRGASHQPRAGGRVSAPRSTRLLFHLRHGFSLIACWRSCARSSHGLGRSRARRSRHAAPLVHRLVAETGVTQETRLQDTGAAAHAPVRLQCGHVEGGDADQRTWLSCLLVLPPEAATTARQPAPLRAPSAGACAHLSCTSLPETTSLLPFGACSATCSASSFHTSTSNLRRAPGGPRRNPMSNCRRGAIAAASPSQRRRKWPQAQPIAV